MLENIPTNFYFCKQDLHRLILSVQLPKISNFLLFDMLALSDLYQLFANSFSVLYYLRSGAVYWQESDDKIRIMIQALQFNML